MTKILVAIASAIAFAQAGVVTLPLDVELRAILAFVLGMVSAGLISYLGGTKASPPA